MLAAKAYFQPSERRTIGAPGRSGSGRRGGSRCELAPPGQKGRVGQIVAARRHLFGHGRHQSGPAGRLGLRQAPRSCATPGHRPRRPGRAPPRPAPARPARARRPGRARLAPRRDCRPTAVRSGATVPAATPRPAVTALTARAWRPETMAWSTSFSVTPADLRASAKASRAKGTYISSPKRSSQTCESASPGTRQRSRNSSLAAPRPMSSATASGAPQRKATPPSPLSRSSDPPARPVRRSDTTARVRRIRGAPRAPSPACRAPNGGHRRSRRRRSHARGRGRRARRWRWSCRGSPEPGWRTGGPGAPRAQSEGAAGGFDPERRGVLVVGGHGPGPLARPRAEHLGDGGAVGVASRAGRCPMTRCRRRSQCW